MHEKMWRESCSLTVKYISVHMVVKAANPGRVRSSTCSWQCFVLLSPKMHFTRNLFDSVLHRWYLDAITNENPTVMLTGWPCIIAIAVHVWSVSRGTLQLNLARYVFLDLQVLSCSIVKFRRVKSAQALDSCERNCRLCRTFAFKIKSKARH